MVVCQKCGRETPSSTAHCEFCGQSLLRTLPDSGESNPFGDSSPYSSPQTHSMAAPVNQKEDLGLRMLVPVGRSPWAIAAGYAGLFSLFFCFLGPFAIGFGVMAIVDLRKKPHLSGMPRAIIGIILGAVGTAAMLFFILAMVFG